MKMGTIFLFALQQTRTRAARLSKTQWLYLRDSQKILCGKSHNVNATLPHARECKAELFPQSGVDAQTLLATHMGDVDLTMILLAALHKDLHKCWTKGPLLAMWESATRITRMMAFMTYLTQHPIKSDTPGTRAQ